MSISRIIKRRRSTRSFLNKPVGINKIRLILDSGRWAPSGLNNQPWRFVVIKNKNIKEKISQFTKYSRVIKQADCLILVFLDKKNSYNLLKDTQAIGACIENMLLCALDLGISSCWLGEILNRKAKVNKSLKISLRYDLMAAVVLGYSPKKTKSNRLALDKLILKELL
ncbi:MAG: nitroreductase family protein [Candidatus Omnitrophica bacterium]|nr:nitroreductase family protein [Candidatus Omnitrophota bacterium]MDD5351676.1 nitroreductase family protein [Candidatus Omnitrophota bacterium]MDD5550886.1 nitroreductase family protein [Candidatus Omnitrophota bacterium]